MNSKYFILFVFLSMIIGCGGSKLEEGDKLFQQGDYSKALTDYLAYKQDNPNDPKINSKIALAYMYKGKDLFDITHNIDTFSGNFEKGNEFLDTGKMDASLSKEYSYILYELASAYNVARPQNDIQKEQYFNNTFDYLEQALDADPNNTKADSMRIALRSENFEKNFNSGQQFYNRAKKERNNADLYLTAEKYLTQADSYKPGDEETTKMLSEVHKATLKILDNTNPQSFAVVNYKTASNTVLVDLTFANFSNDPFTVDPEAFILSGNGDNTLSPDLAVTAKYNNAITEKKEIAPRKTLDGVIVFSTTAGFKPDFISYKINDNLTVKKYFP